MRWRFVFATRFFPLALGFLSCFCAESIVFAQPGRDKEPLSWDRNVHSKFSQFCYACHHAEEPSGDVDLARDKDPRLIVQHRKQWLVALEMLRSGQMPPEDERQPGDKDRELMIDFLELTVENFDCESVNDPGEPVLRRLNRTEYDNAVLDLTGLDLQLADSFPPDPTSYGFDNIGGSLSLTPVQVEMYHTAAGAIVNAILNSREDRREVYDRIFAVGNVDLDPRERARIVLTRFASRAFRQPVDSYYVNRLLRIFDKALAEDQAYDRAVGHCLTAVLMSSRFLMRIELDRPDSDQPYAISDYELASRLSFFLWSRPPDQTLLALAKANRLREPEVLDSQIVRMLKDQRSSALVENFFFQWLDLRGLANHHPDPTVFPQFDEALRWSMREEVRLLLTDLVRKDLPLTSVIDADFAYLNNRLARHYKLDDVGSEKPQRVALSNKRRGGLITSAAFLMLQSDPGRTNIPRRGNFIAAQILDDGPPPPPADVPALEPIDDGVMRTLRESFELHRSSPDCKGCHSKIDPLGFSLENYDAIGQWREKDSGATIDASGETAAGEAFCGPAGLKAYLRSREDDFLSAFASKLMIYALGRGLRTSDDCVIEDMVKVAKNDEYRLSSIVRELVTSVPFTYRKSPGY